MSNLVATADKEGALVLQRPCAGRDAGRESFQVACWLAEHYHPQSCLDIIAALQKQPAVRRAIEESEAELEYEGR